MKIGVIGLDGMSRRYLLKLVNMGYMPYTKHLLNRSRINVDLAAYPPVTPASWPTIMTGVNPAKHGIYDFIHYDKSRREVHIMDSLYLEHPRIHEMLSYIGMKSVMINPVPSYPVIPVKNTIIFSLEFFTPRPIIYPSNKGEKYKKYVKNISMKHGAFEETVISSLKNTEKYIELTEKIFAEEDFHLFWINLHYPDIILHAADNSGLYNIFEESYSSEGRLWSKIDKLIKFVGENTDNLVMVSDHGFAIYHKNILLNDLLYNYGFIKASKYGLMNKVRGMREKAQLKKINLPLEEVKDLRIMDLRVARTIYYNKILRRLLKPFVKIPLKLYRKITGKRVRIVLSDISEDSIAFGLTRSSFYGIYVNKKDYIDDIVKKISSFEGISRVVKKEELFNGPYIDRLPDIYVLPDFDKGYRISVSHLYGKLLVEKKALDHHPMGIFVMRDYMGRNDGDRVLPNSIVAPLIMSYLDLPLPISIDNKDLLTELIGNGSKIKFTNKYLALWKTAKKVLLLARKLHT